MTIPTFHLLFYCAIILALTILRVKVQMMLMSLVLVFLNDQLKVVDDVSQACQLILSKVVQSSAR